VRDDVGETDRLVHLLEAVIDGPSKINAIPSLREAKRRAQQLDNRLGRLRAQLLEIEQDEMEGENPEIDRLSEERRKLDEKLEALPTTDAEFEERDARARQECDRMGQELSRDQIRLDQLSATAVAIERFVSNSDYTKAVSLENVNMVVEELNRHRIGVAQMHDEIMQLKTDVESARYQVGIGDSRDISDESLRAEISNIARKERSLLRGRQDDFSQRLDNINAVIDGAENTLAAFEQALQDEAMVLIEKIKNQVELEAKHVEGYRKELSNLDGEAKDVVAGVAFDSMSNIKKRFHDLILSADVGIIDVGWLEKEEHRSRRDELTKERLSTIQNLDDEFHEVIASPTD
jgi:hypothetical protein